NAGGPCRGDGKDATTNKICDSFPMYGPPCLVAVVTFGFAIVVTLAVACVSMRKEKMLRLTIEKEKAAALAAANASPNDLATTGVELSNGGGMIDKPVEGVLL
ncbi:hypothetical protein Gpo141_00013476, partial [Globisporangium polare]